MKVVLGMAISPNGMIARENGEEDWLPSEGWDEFLSTAKEYNNIVMGRETYELVTKLYKNYNFDSVKVDLKIIVSNNPDFVAPDGYFVVDSPQSAVDMVTSKGLSQTLLIGGGKLNSSFIKMNLIDEIHLTITPYIIGKGRSFINPEDFDLPLELISADVISKGRVNVKYKVRK